MPLAQMFVQILKIPRQLLLPLIVLMCLLWLRLTAAGTPLRLASAHVAPV